MIESASSLRARFLPRRTKNQICEEIEPHGHDPVVELCAESPDMQNCRIFPEIFPSQRPGLPCSTTKTLLKFETHDNTSGFCETTATEWDKSWFFQPHERISWIHEMDSQYQALYFFLLNNSSWDGKPETKHPGSRHFLKFVCFLSTSQAGNAL